jgi:putative membrane protein
MRLSLLARRVAWPPAPFNRLPQGLSSTQSLRHDAAHQQQEARMSYFGQGQYLASIMGLPSFALYFAVSAAVLMLFIAVYIRTTAHREIQLIREGNIAAAIALGGATLGFAIPLGKSVAQAVSVPDMLIWAFAAFIVQLLVFRVVQMAVPDLSAKIESGNIAAGTFLGASALASGMLNASAMTV